MICLEKRSSTVPAEPRAAGRPLRLAGAGSPLTPPGIAGVAGVCAMRSSFASNGVTLGPLVN